MQIQSTSTEPTSVKAVRARNRTALRYATAVATVMEHLEVIEVMVTSIAYTVTERRRQAEEIVKAVLALAGPR